MIGRIVDGFPLSCIGVNLKITPMARCRNRGLNPLLQTRP